MGARVQLPGLANHQRVGGAILRGNNVQVGSAIVAEHAAAPLGKGTIVIVIIRRGATIKQVVAPAGAVPLVPVVGPGPEGCLFSRRCV